MHKSDFCLSTVCVSIFSCTMSKLGEVVVAWLETVLHPSYQGEGRAGPLRPCGGSLHRVDRLRTESGVTVLLLVLRSCPELIHLSSPIYSPVTVRHPLLPKLEAKEDSLNFLYQYTRYESISLQVPDHKHTVGELLGPGQILTIKTIIFCGGFSQYVCSEVEFFLII